MNKLSVAGALGALGRASETHKRLLERADFDVGVYRPGEIDDQTPHARDEIYIVAAGTGEFICAGEREKFGPSDAFFAAKGVDTDLKTSRMILQPG